MTNNFGIRQGYTSRPAPNYFADMKPDGKIWQCDVIPIAVHLARQNSISRIIDIGCGRATGFLPYSGEFEYTGVDFGENIDYCRDTYGWGTWINHNLESGLPELDAKDAVIVCADVIEHLLNPDNLVIDLAGSLVCAKVSLISTPDRMRVYGYDQSGMPGNQFHIREWMLPEMVEWLQTFPLRIAWAGWTRSNNVDVSKNTLLIAATNPRSSYTVEHVQNTFDVEMWKYA